MQNILIIKTGAAGDVVRTTSLLNVLKGNIYWIVDTKNRWIFPDNLPGLHILTQADFERLNLGDITFDVVLSLEEDPACAQLASSVTSKQLIGVYLNQEGLTYSPQSSGWYDMSLISKKGSVVANALKKSNPFSFQHWLFNMVAKEFTNEPYVIYQDPAIKPIKGLVGIERRVGETWPNKGWNGYELLEKKIMSLGYQVRHFQQKENMRDYFDDIAQCSCIISGDSLPMHVAIAYQIPCIAIFNCTPPDEIHGYGHLTKIVSPLLKEFLYQPHYDEEVVSSIRVETVISAFSELGISK
jgi:heptosyltransferase II